jgi:hypothetical protein
MAKLKHRRAAPQMTTWKGAEIDFSSTPFRFASFLTSKFINPHSPIINPI